MVWGLGVERDCYRSNKDLDSLGVGGGEGGGGETSIYQICAREIATFK